MFPSQSVHNNQLEQQKFTFHIFQHHDRGVHLYTISSEGESDLEKKGTNMEVSRAISVLPSMSPFTWCQAGPSHQDVPTSWDGCVDGFLRAREYSVVCAHARHRCMNYAVMNAVLRSRDENKDKRALGEMLWGKEWMRGRKKF